MNPNDTNMTGLPDELGTATQTPDSSENSTFPLGVGEGGGLDGEAALDPLAGAESAKRSNTGTLLIVLVIIVAAGGLFSMRTLAKVTASVNDDAEVEQTIESLLAQFSGSATPGEGKKSVLMEDASPALRVLNESYSERQVPWENVQGNPFILAVPTTDATPDVQPDNGNASLRDWERRRREKMAKIDEAGKRLTLSSTLLGSNPLANINNTILRVGDTLKQGDVLFRLTDIRSDSVTLVGEDLALDIEMEVVVEIDRD